MPAYIAVAHYHSNLEDNLLENVNNEVNALLPKESSFGIVKSNGSLANIDFSWFKNGTPEKRSDALVLCLQKNSKLIAVSITSGSGINQPNSKTLINWIGHVDETRYNSPPPDFSEEILFDVDTIDQDGEDQKYVYHYTKWGIAKDYILGGQQQFLVNIAKKMNDPLEQKSYEFINHIERSQLKEEQLFKLNNALKKVCEEHIRIFSTSLDRKAETRASNYNGQIRTMIIKKRVRGFDHPKMWAHYGDNHNGVCLILKKEAINSRIIAAAGDNTVVSDKINYNLPFSSTDILKGVKIETNAKIANGSEKEIEDWAIGEIQKLIPKLFFTKHEDWSSEVEHRWIIGGRFAGDFFVPIKPEDIAAIVVGSDFQMDLFESAKEIAEKNAIPLRIMMWSFGQAAPPWRLLSDDDPDYIREYFTKRDEESKMRK